MTTIKKGRPRQYEEFTYFGMKVTPQEKAQICALAQLAGTTAKQAIIQLVQQAIHGEYIQPYAAQRELLMKTNELKQLSPQERSRIIQIQVNTIKAFNQQEIIEDYEDILDD